MQIHQLGMTGLKVSRIGLGLAALGRPGYINLGHAEDLGKEYDVQEMEARTHAMLDFAFEKGIRYFDAARSYGRGEEFLGNWLRKRGVSLEEITVGSKWGYTYTANWQVEADKHEVKEHSLPVLNRQWGESVGNLGSFLRLYQIHSATLESGVLENQDVLEELARLKGEGIQIGLTLSGPSQVETLKRALDIVTGGTRLFDTVQTTWNVLEPSAGPTLRQAHDLGMGVIIKEALANGRLTSRNEDPQFSDRKARLQGLAERFQTTIDAVALAAVLAQPWVDVVLSGAAQKEHLSSNLEALEFPWDESAQETVQELAESPQDYWQFRSSLSWN